MSNARPPIPHSALRTPHWVLAGCVLLGAALRGVGLTRQGFWTDELYVVWEARQPWAVLFDPRLHIQHPPGYRLALHVWLGVSTAEAWIRLLPWLAGVLLIPLLWALARAVWPGQPAAWHAAALLAATSPFLIHYSQDVTTYSWTMLWVTASVLALIYAWRSDRVGWWAAWAVTAAVAAYSHYFSIFPLVAEGLAVLVAARPAGPTTGPRLRHAAAAAAGATVLVLPWIGVLLTGSQGELTNPIYPPSVDTQPTGWLAVLLAGYANPGFWLSKAGRALAWSLVLGVLALGLIAKFGDFRFWVVDFRQATDKSKIQNPKSKILLLGWGLAAFVGPYLFLRLTTPPDAETPVRFAALAAPALLLGLAGAGAALPAVGRAAALTAWLALAAVQTGSALVAAPAQDWRGVLGQVAAEALPGDVFLAFPAFHAGAAAAYYPVPLPVQGGWFVPEGADATGAAYWFPPGWQWRGFLNPTATRSTDWPGQLALHLGQARRLWYLAGDGVDGTYPSSRAAEQALRGLGWQPVQAWPASPLVLRLYIKPAP